VAPGLTGALACQRADGGEGIKLLFRGLDHLLPGLHLHQRQGGVVGDGIDADQDIGLLLGHAGAFCPYLACYLAKIVQHLRKRKHQRGGKTVVVAVMGIAVFHPGIDLGIVFRFRDIHLLCLFIELAHRLANSRMPGDGAGDGVLYR